MSKPKRTINRPRGITARSRITAAEALDQGWSQGTRLRSKEWLRDKEICDLTRFDILIRDTRADGTNHSIRCVTTLPPDVEMVDE